MNRKHIISIAFVLLILAQWYVPGKMIWENERAWLLGTTHHFKTAPVDPIDIFRGKYIDLSFEGIIVKVQNAGDWTEGEEVYGILSTDPDGYSYISSLVKNKPAKDVECLRLSIRYVPGSGRDEVHIDFPFNRFYMEESKALPAELSYRESSRDSTSTTYAVVSILDGEAVLKDVMIDGVPIKEVAETLLENTDQ